MKLHLLFLFIITIFFTACSVKPLAPIQFDTIKEEIDENKEVDDDNLDRKLLEAEDKQRQGNSNEYEDGKTLSTVNGTSFRVNDEELEATSERLRIPRDVNVMGYLPEHQMMKDTDRQNNLSNVPMSRQLLSICRNLDYSEIEVLLQLKAICVCLV